jgi:hypothetical protein
MPERLHPTIVMMPDASGNFMRFQHFAAGPVRTDIPERERVPLLVRYSHGSYIITYYDGSFRHPANGSNWARPLEWAYITWAPVDDTNYDGQGPYLPESKAEWLYDTIRIIAKHHKIRDVQDAMDKTPWPNDVEGEPEQ